LPIFDKSPNAPACGASKGEVCFTAAFARGLRGLFAPALVRRAVFDDDLLAMAVLLEQND
jgi:hypothetical protein